MIPTRHYRLTDKEKLLMFQSRNRETYDSNDTLTYRLADYTPSFNLVIEKLMIPT